MSGVMGLAPSYNIRRFSFMAAAGPHMPVTEPYVCIPPALVIRDNEGATWTLGFDYDEREWRGGKWEYDCLRNGTQTGEWCRIIEFRRGRVRIWGADGWRTWIDGRFV